MSPSTMSREYDHLFKLLIIGDSGKQGRVKQGEGGRARLG